MVTGFAGSDAKVDYLKSVGYDCAYNYKTSSLKDSLAEACPKGPDMFYDHVSHSNISYFVTFKMHVLIIG